MAPGGNDTIGPDPDEADHGAEGLAGGRLARDTSWIVTLTEAEIADIDRALAAARASGRPLEEIDRASFPLTVMRPRLEQALAEMYDGRGFVVLRGLPVERYSDDDVGLIFWGMGRYLGAPLYQNPQGELLGHVYDHGRTYGNIDVRGYETNAYLPYHTDAGDMVGLLCLRRGLEGGLSSIVSSVTVHNEILAAASRVPRAPLQRLLLHPPRGGADRARRLRRGRSRCSATRTAS